MTRATCMLPLKQHLERLRGRPCICCGVSGPSVLHHCIGGSLVPIMGVRGTQKRSDWLCLPLCTDDHDALHRGIETWERRLGKTEAQLIDKLGKIYGIDLWAMAQAERDGKRQDRRYKRPAKLELGRA